MSFKSDRLIELDILRGLSIIGVILIHIIGGSFNFWKEGSTTWTAFISIDQFFRFSVPLFVFISGYTLFAKYSHGFKLWEFYKRRAIRVLPWYVVWSLIIYIYLHSQVKPGFVDYPTWKLILLGKVDYHLYFVSMIFQLYLLFPFLVWIYKKLRSKFVVLLFGLEAILYLTFTLDGQKIIHLPWRFYEQQQYLFFGTWIFYFVLGFVIYEKRNIFLITHKIFSKNIIFVFATVAVLAFAIFDSLHVISATGDTNVATRSTRILVLLYSTSFIISALVYSDLLIKMKKVIVRILLYFAKISFLVYLIHALMIRVLGNFFWPDTVFNLSLFTIIVFCLSIFFAQLSLWIADILPFHKLKLMRNMFFKSTNI